MALTSKDVVGIRGFGECYFQVDVNDYHSDLLYSFVYVPLNHDFVSYSNLYFLWLHVFFFLFPIRNT